jgi:hypothetical protein
MNPAMQQAMMQQTQQPMPQQQMQSPWMGMQGQPNPMEGQMLAQGFPPAPQAQVDLANMFKPKTTPAPSAEPYQGLSPTLVEKLRKIQGR